MLLTTQYMEEADQLADRVLVIVHGETITEGTPPDELKRLIGAERIEVTVTAGSSASTPARCWTVSRSGSSRWTNARARW